MKTALVVLFAVVIVNVGATDFIGKAHERTVRDTIVYGGAAQAKAAAIGEKAAAASVVLDEPEGTLSGSAASAKYGAVSSSSMIGKSKVHKYD